jgi:hypothetical protein
MQGFLRGLYETRVHAGRLFRSYLSHGELESELYYVGADTLPQLIETELHRKIKPALGIESDVLFQKEIQDVGRTDVVGELWSFS